MTEEPETSSRREYQKRKKTKNKKVPKVKKRYSTRRFKLGLLVLTVFISVSGVLALIRSNGVAMRVNGVKIDISKISKNVKKLNNQNISYTPALQEFSKHVVDLYMNVSSDQVLQEKRSADLKTVYAAGLEEDVSPSKVERKLVNSTFLNLERVDGVNTAKYKVDYQLITTKKVQKEVDEKYKDGDQEKNRKVKKDVDEKVAKAVTNVLCIPYVNQSNTLSVVALPYLQAYTETKSNAMAIKPSDDSTSITNQKVDKFLKAFFEKYVDSKTSDMQFLMSSPESLNGTVSFDDYDAQVFKEHKGFKVHADVYFKEKDTDFRRHEQMTLHLIKKDKTFFITKIIHNLGK